MNWHNKISSAIRMSFWEVISEPTVLITGITGFLGGNLASLLRSECPGARIVGTSTRGCSSPSSSIQKIQLTELDDLVRLVGDLQPDYVFHMAGVRNVFDWQSLYAVNVQGTINLLEAVKIAYSAAKVIIPGSAAEYGRVSKFDLPITELQPANPVSRYGVAKLWQTSVSRYYAMNGVNVVVARIFNLIGRGTPAGLSPGAFASQLRRVMHGNQLSRIVVGNLDAKRDFVDVTDVCRAVIQLAEAGRAGEIYNVCSGTSIATGDLLSTMIKQLGIDVEVVTDPTMVRSNEIDESCGSNDKLRLETGWFPRVSLFTSIDKMLREDTRITD